METIMPDERNGIDWGGVRHALVGIAQPLSFAGILICLFVMVTATAWQVSLGCFIGGLMFAALAGAALLIDD